MQGYNILFILNRIGNKVLMCKRGREPFRGLYNLIGGKIEPGEGGLDAAYREMREESGILPGQIELVHLMDFTYYVSDTLIEVYAGRLKTDVTVAGDENELYWIDINRNFFDTSVFAGGGNIGHIMEQIKTGNFLN